MLRHFLDLLLPTYCVGCKLEGTALCQDCYNLIRLPDATRCPFCETETPAGRACPQHQEHALAGCLSCGYYHDPILQAAIKQFKYHYHEELANPLSNHLARVISRFHTIIPEAQAVIPIPLSGRKQRSRGFNQALPLAQAVAKTLNIPTMTDLLVRTRHTHPQAKLSDEKRRASMTNAFRAVTKINGSILLVDDVLTTGATMEAAAQALKAAGAASVFGIVLARG